MSRVSAPNSAADIAAAPRSFLAPKRGG